MPRSLRRISGKQIFFRKRRSVPVREREEMREGEKLCFEEYLDQFGTLTYTCRGVSMLPMLRQKRDILVITKKGPERCKKYDVALYIRPPHDYVLHRVVEVRDKDYVILGDNCLKKEYGIRDEDILGVLSSFVRNGKTIRMDSRGQMLYAKIWYALYPARRMWKINFGRFKRLVKKVLVALHLYRK